MSTNPLAFAHNTQWLVTVRLRIFTPSIAHLPSLLGYVNVCVRISDFATSHPCLAERPCRGPMEPHGESVASAYVRTSYHLLLAARGRIQTF